MTRRAPSPTLCFWLAIAAVVTSTASAAVNFMYHQRVLDRLYLVERKISEEAKLLTSTWTSGGIQRSWTSTQQPGETLEQLIARHQAEMAQMLAAFPPDNPDDGK